MSLDADTKPPQDFEKHRDAAAEKYRDEDFEKHPNGYAVGPYINYHAMEYAFCAGADWARMVLDAGIHSELIKERDALKAELSAAAEGMNAHDKSRANVILERDALKAEVERLNALLNYPHLPLYKESEELTKERDKSRRLAEALKTLLQEMENECPGILNEPELARILGILAAYEGEK
jgi:hypothetical protein